jgi:uncharacterized protein
LSGIVRPFHIMAKPVCGVCNLDCRYCYYTMKPRELYPGVSEFHMGDTVLERYTREYTAAMPARVEFGWQGGEPLLAGKDFFRRAVALQKEYARPGQVVTNGLQTNGTLLDEEWADFLAEETFLVGISLDGPPQVHDYFRRDHAGKPTFERAWAGLELLAERGVEFNVLVTLNAATAPHAGNIYRYFVNRGVRYLQFIPILERRPGTDEPTDYSCTGEQYGRFLLDVFENWIARDVGRVSVRLFDSVLHSFIYGAASTCVHSERCAAAYVLEWNGDLYACDHFVFDEWHVGNVMETPLVDLVTGERIEEFAQLKTDLPAACRDCEYLKFCWSGCPKHHRPIGTDPDRVNHFCEGYKAFFEEALPELERVAEAVRRGEPLPRKVEAVSAAAAPSAATGGVPAAKVGRNAPCPCGSGRKYKNCCGRR